MVRNINYPQYFYQSGRTNQDLPAYNEFRLKYDKHNATLDPKLARDIEDIKDILDIFALQKKADSENKSKALLSPVPFVRKLDGAQESFKEGDILKSLGKFGLLAACLPEDTRDVNNAVNQILGKGDKSIPYSYQPKFSFFRGTLFESGLKKLNDSQNSTLQSIGKKIYKADKTLYDTQLGLKFLKKLGWQDDLAKNTSRIDFMDRVIQGSKIKGSLISKILGKSMLRIPTLSIITLSILEIPSIIKAFTQKDNSKDNLINGTKQTVKSGINVSSLLSGGAVLGAIGQSLLGPVGSLIGLGLGSYYGSQTGKFINDKIDRI
ncbi:MAG: hypothetical protein A2287_09385 [Candidatus Melainabacteria bacterium RIFOXYA12_FULL_32_12]|nr:MAG: hypothetical protein A2255_07515 [Candidatus Melainabacteria bacterium RIFOXYA2_FULL_32_9]OGI31213.1 MAG: hypothetical protein A2287_09385 [Candidatus Melainabacteria bacterium RIFOXYA12_FULL_32_12]